MHEASKAIARRLHTPGFATHYFVGHGLDVVSGNDSLGKYAALFPRITSVADFDLPDGDAQLTQRSFSCIARTVSNRNVHAC